MDGRERDRDRQRSWKRKDSWTINCHHKFVFLHTGKGLVCFLQVFVVRSSHFEHRGFLTSSNAKLTSSCSSPLNTRINPEMMHKTSKREVTKVQLEAIFIRNSRWEKTYKIRARCWPLNRRKLYRSQNLESGKYVASQLLNSKKIDVYIRFCFRSIQ